MSAAREDLIRKVREIACRVASSEGIEVVDVQLLGPGSRRTLRIFIDKPEGISHADCTLISDQVGTILDVEDVMPGGSYHLEVSSPGLERTLTKPADFQRFLGRKAKILLRDAVDNQRHWQGTLAGFEDGIITLEPSPGKAVRFELSKVERANLKFEW